MLKITQIENSMFFLDCCTECGNSSFFTFQVEEGGEGNYFCTFFYLCEKCKTFMTEKERKKRATYSSFPSENGEYSFSYPEKRRFFSLDEKSENGLTKAGRFYKTILIEDEILKRFPEMRITK